MSIRPVKEILKATATVEGAGVHLQRAFGFGKTEAFDPFLLLDDFRNERPEAYKACTTTTTSFPRAWLRTTLMSSWTRTEMSTTGAMT